MLKYLHTCSEGLKEANWVRWTAQDMQIPVPPVAVLQVDNKQVESFKNATCAKSKLRGTTSNRWNWVKEFREEGNCVVKHVDTKDNKADPLTKCLDCKEFKRQVQMVQGRRLKYKRISKNDVTVETVANVFN